MAETDMAVLALAKQRQFLEDIIAGKQSVELLIMPNTKCNLGCAYCAPGGFSTVNTKYERMSQDILNRIISLAADFKRRNGGRVNLLGHGFEPLLAGKEFFRHLGTQAQEANVNLNIQTNGTLIDKEWADIFVAHQIGIGVSLDGPEDVHNAARLFHSGAGSYKAAMRGVMFLREVGMDCGVISVLSNAHIRKGVGQWYDWLLENKFYKADLHLPSAAITNTFFKPLAPTVEEVTSVILSLYELWKNKTDGVAISMFELFVHGLLHGTPPAAACTLTSGCHTAIGFDHLGQIALCDSKVYEIGNIKDIESLEDLFLHPAMLASHKRPLLIAQREESCRKCDYLELCSGGCTHEAIVDAQDPYRKTKFCDTYHALYQKIEQDLTEKGALKGKPWKAKNTLPKPNN